MMPAPQKGLVGGQRPVMWGTQPPRPAHGLREQPQDTPAGRSGHTCRTEPGDVRTCEAGSRIFWKRPRAGRGGLGAPGTGRGSRLHADSGACHPADPRLWAELVKDLRLQPGVGTAEDVGAAVDAAAAPGTAGGQWASVAFGGQGAGCGPSQCRGCGGGRLVRAPPSPRTPGSGGSGGSERWGRGCVFFAEAEVTGDTLSRLTHTPCRFDSN